jgi:D-beta-D-heptose 7-phosphate kinase/D-beta-D-heptose 1-phosphate adenosyltransferase
VPVVWAQAQSYMPGGASNVANNIAALGGTVYLCGVFGDDKNAQILRTHLQDRGVCCEDCVVDASRPTTVKTRVIAAHQQMVRVDWEKLEPLSCDHVEKLIASVTRRIKEVDALIIEDYGKGVISPLVLKRVIDLARRHEKIVTVDPKVEHFSYYRGVTALTPNEKEASAGAQLAIETDADVDRAGWKLLKSLACGGVLITRGEKGMSLFQARGVTHIPTVAQEIFDVSGAGDTVISVFTLALSAGVSMKDAAMIANVAAGVVVGKVGVAVVHREEILRGWDRLRAVRHRIVEHSLSRRRGDR